MSKISNPHTRGVAEFVAGLRYEAIPREVRQRIKLLVLDSLGCALYGAHLQWCRILQRTLTKLDRSVACGVWGTAQRLSAPHAALANGTQVQGSSSTTCTAKACCTWARWCCRLSWPLRSCAAE